MFKVLIVVGLLWLALLPPLFTDGACNAEYEQVEALVAAHKKELGSPGTAQAFLRTQGLDATILTTDDCAKAKPRFLWQCGSGTLVFAHVPVRDRICRFYRDDSTRIELHFDRRDRLAKTVTEMKPYKYLPLPGGRAIHWAR